MARGFGATRGATSTDVVTTACKSEATQRTWAISWRRNGSGGGGAGRFWEKTEGAIEYEALYYENANSRMIFLERYSGANETWGITGGNVAVAGQWHRMILQRDHGVSSNQPVCILNGTTLTVSVNNTPGTKDSHASAVYILGNVASANRVFDGDLANWAVWEGMLNSAEIAAYMAGYSPRLIRPDIRVSCVEMMRGLLDLDTGASAVATGTSVQAHPETRMPKRKLSFIGVPAPSVGFARRQYNRFPYLEGVY